MQHEYVIPFCQSEYFLSNLCGPRPVDIGELIASGEHTKSNGCLPSAVEPNYSLAQFRLIKFSQLLHFYVSSLCF